MLKTVHSSGVKGTLKAPASKSVMIRAVAASLLARGTSRLLNTSFCTDSLVALIIADALGAGMHTGTDDLSIDGTAGLTAGDFKKTTIQCGESGLCMRMFTPIAGLTRHKFVIEGSGSLRSRPMKMVEALSQMGGTCATNEGYPPITLQGPLKGGMVTLDGSESSQFLTGLLMAAPLCKEDSVIEVRDLKSKPYVEMTIDLLRQFGIAIGSDETLSSFRIRGNQQYAGQTYVIEGDWSGAAFLLVAGAIAGSMKVEGLRNDSFQADKDILEGLRKAGAHVEVTDGSILVERKHLNAFEFDAGNCPDLVPPLTALAAHCRGKSIIHGTERLKYKESNRALTLASEFAKLSVKIDLLPDRMEIHGGNKLAGNLVDSHNDHRIAMACSVAALDGTEPVVIRHAECVAKSYPHFYEDLNSVKVAL